MSDTALRTILNQQSELEKVKIKFEQPKEKPLLDELSIELFNIGEGQAFCTVDGKGNVKSVFGYNFLKGLLEHHGLSMEEFFESKGWKYEVISE